MINYTPIVQGQASLGYLKPYYYNVVLRVLLYYGPPNVVECFYSGSGVAECFSPAGYATWCDNSVMKQSTVTMT